MSVKTVYECDICGEQRKEANHWWFAKTTAMGRLQLWEWALGDDEGAKHLCGEQCVQKFIGRFLICPTSDPVSLPTLPNPLPVLEDEIPW